MSLKINTICKKYTKKGCATFYNHYCKGFAEDDLVLLKYFRVDKWEWFDEENGLNDRLVDCQKEQDIVFFQFYKNYFIILLS